MRLDFCFFRRHIKTRRAIDAVAVEQRHGWHTQLVAPGDQVLGQGGAFEKTKGRAGMEFDEHRPWLEGGVSYFVRLIVARQGRIVKGG